MADQGNPPCAPHENCVVVKEKISSSWQNYKIKFQILGQTKAEIKLLGPKKKNSHGVFYPVIVDFRNVKLNDQNIFVNTQKADQSAPLIYTFEAQNNDIFTLEMDIQRHRWTWSEFKDLQHLNVLMLFSVFILSFFFSYKLVQYIAAFNLNFSRVEIFFLVAVVIFCLFPISYISKADKSAQENRMLAKSPQFFIDHTFNPEFTKEFESWFNDRFRGRKNFLRLYAYINSLNNMAKNNQATYNRKTHWAFNQDQLTHQPLSEKENKEILKAFQDLSKFFAAHKISFYFLLVPAKVDIYKKENDLYIFDDMPKAESALNISTVSYLQKNASFPIVYPLEALKKAAKENFVYFKTEHHWTEWGAYNGYLALAKTIQKDFPNLKIAQESDFDIFYNKKVRGDWDRKFKIGQTVDLLNLKLDENEDLGTDYKYYSPKQSVDQKIDERIGTKFFKNPNNKTHLRAMLSSTSMAENLLPFLPFSFSELKYYRINWTQPEEEQYKLIKNLKKEILANKPDIFILCLTATNLQKTVDFTKD